MYLRRRGIVLIVLPKQGAVQLRGNREADLRLCFHTSILLVFLCSGSYYKSKNYFSKLDTLSLIFLYVDRFFFIGKSLNNISLET